MNFLPETYDIPKGQTNYMALEEGTNKFRILSSAITGYEYWNITNKPTRQKEAFKSIPEDIRIDEEGKYRIAHFWAFVVWNYAVGVVQILEIKQATIQRAMKIKIDNRDGDAKGYDFIITKTGKGLLTEYDIDFTEAKPILPEIEMAYNAKQINLEALYSGEDPFQLTVNK